ncbi:bifunctional adenosylcobinamide kinase/adenosylcobinamide-phosphate guanylyltransferase [Corynebacterium xerosis]|uniref:bifunctional adenosylcobinamide kinase/adenosylcobinamide-phosphate guanylyltransferase n=1 Tax=Corynebacterium xerosis TaxID=1725 RepID=UPI001F09AA45|nr:bifunctional adenosylcobinamide kinase/adenosylcobinamide-phosphate guanylyltransferase [Corynebacterium xerosis]
MRTLVLGGARSGKSAWAESLFDGHRPSGSPQDSVAVDYVATARPWPGADDFDADFAARIAGHRERRPAHWRTVEDVDAVEALRRPLSPHVLLDDVGTWLTGVFDCEDLWDSPRGSVAPWTDELVAAVRDWPGAGPATGTSAAPFAGFSTGFSTNPSGRSGDDSPAVADVPGESGETRDVVKREPHLVMVTPEVGMGVIPEHRSGRLFRDEIGLLNGRLAEVCDQVMLVVAGMPLRLK